MPIKINRVKVFKGVHEKVHAEYYQVIGYAKPKFGNPPRVETVQEGKALNVLLGEIRRYGISWTRVERETIRDVFIPWREQINANPN
jgi:hypothetical protein